MSQSAPIQVSIAMATYNGAAYLQEQLDSFVAQTRLPDELVVTDDCSTDETLAIIERFAENAPFEVRWEQNEKNLGYCGNFNAALMKTTGDLVFLSDQDDVWFPEKIEHMIGVAERNPQALVVMNDAALTDGELNEVGLTKVGQIRSAGFGMDSFVMGCCCAVRRELLDICLPISNGYKAHDSWLVTFADALKAKVIDEIPLQYYRRHDANESKFIANRTTKVTRNHAFFYSMKTLFRADGTSQAATLHGQLLLLTQGINIAKEKASNRHKAALMNFHKNTEARLDILERRIQIRQKSLFSRSFAALRLLADGGYRDVSGVKSMLRDIVG